MTTRLDREALRAWLDRGITPPQPWVTVTEPDGAPGEWWRPTGTDADGYVTWRSFEHKPCVCHRGYVLAPASDYGWVMAKCARCGANTGETGETSSISNDAPRSMEKTNEPR